MSNSIKYTNKGGFIKLRAVKVDSYGFKIQVIDNGVGIDAKELPTLFEAFKKIQENRSLNKLGCGLGLTLSKKLSNALGGDLTVESEKGKGSTFSIIFKSKEPLDDPMINF